MTAAFNRTTLIARVLVRVILASERSSQNAQWNFVKTLCVGAAPGRKMQTCLPTSHVSCTTQVEAVEALHVFPGHDEHWSLSKEKNCMVIVYI